MGDPPEEHRPILVASQIFYLVARQHAANTVSAQHSIVLSLQSLRASNWGRIFRATLRVLRHEPSAGQLRLDGICDNCGALARRDGDELS